MWSLGSCPGALVALLQCLWTWTLPPSWSKSSEFSVQAAQRLFKGWLHARCHPPDGQSNGPVVWEGRTPGRDATTGLARLRALWGLHKKTGKRFFWRNPEATFWLFWKLQGCGWFRAWHGWRPGWCILRPSLFFTLLPYVIAAMYQNSDGVRLTDWLTLSRRRRVNYRWCCSNG